MNRAVQCLCVVTMAIGCAKGPPTRADGRVECLTFVAPSGWAAAPLDGKSVRGWILTAPDHTEFRVWGVRTALTTPRHVMETTLSRWELEASGDGGASAPRLDALSIDGEPALLMQSSRSEERDGVILDTRRNLLSLVHDGIAYTAAAVYELPRDAPDPLAPLATGFIHSIRLRCEGLTPSPGR